MAGNSLGPRGKFIYTSDAGNTYSLLLDATLGEAAGLPQRDATSGATATGKPTRFKPRVVFLEATVPVEDGEEGETVTLRKELVVNRTNALYNSNSIGTVSIDGVEFTSTGRRGEKMSF